MCNETSAWCDHIGPPVALQGHTNNHMFVFHLSHDLCPRMSDISGSRHQFSFSFSVFSCCVRQSLQHCLQHHSFIKHGSMSPACEIEQRQNPYICCTSTVQNIWSVSEATGQRMIAADRGWSRLMVASQSHPRFKVFKVLKSRQETS